MREGGQLGAVSLSRHVTAALASVRADSWFSLPAPLHLPAAQAFDKGTCVRLRPVRTARLRGGHPDFAE